MAKTKPSQLLKQRREENLEDTDTAITALYSELMPNPIPPSAKSKFADIQMTRLHDFFTAVIKFKYLESDLLSLTESIREHGLFNRILVRPIPGTDDYEILSGHSRFRACQRLGWTTIPAEILYVDDVKATVIAILTNTEHRPTLLPSERGWAYRSLLEATKSQGQRSDLTSVENQQKLDARSTLAKHFRAKPWEVQRDIRLTYLIDPFLDAVDNKKLRISCGVKLSNYDTDTQTKLYLIWSTRNCNLTPKAMNFILGACPPPSASNQSLLHAWSEAFKPQSLTPKITFSFQRTCLEPYLSKVGDNTEELQRLFIKFLEAESRKNNEEAST